MAKLKSSNWLLGQVLIGIFLALPSLFILSDLLGPYSETWEHLRDTVLISYIANSTILLVGVGLGTLFIGVGTAWLVAMCEFPGRNFLSWGLLLPLAMPTYIIAYAYTDLMDVLGPIQTGLRMAFDWEVGEYVFPPIRSIGGAIFVMSFVLYPYVYLLARIAFLNQSGSLIETGRSLGLNSWQCFRKIALPIARPAIVAGLSLALMETLADFGTVEYFGIGVFTTGIFRTWYGLGDLQTASQLSAMLLLAVLALMMLERISREKLRFYNPTKNLRTSRHQLSKALGNFCFSLGMIPVCVGFLFPALRLLALSAKDGLSSINLDFLVLIWNTFSIAASASILCLSLAVLLVYGKRLTSGKISAAALRLATSGYAIPGTVIAIGVLMVLSFIDHVTNVFVSGSILALLFAYTVRFIAISTQSIESGLEQIRPNIDESSQILGATSFRMIRSIHFPLIRGSMITASLLVFVDVLKELPATLILRPFDFNTLAVKTYELAGDERLADASLPALTIVMAGIIPVILLTKNLSKTGQKW